MQTPSTLKGPRTPTVLTTMRFAFAPTAFADEGRARFGSVYRVRTLLGPSVFTTDPEHLRRIFTADSDVLHTYATNTLTPVFGAKSVILTSGAPHKRLRKLLTPPLAGARLRAFGATMAALANARVGAVRAGDVLRVHDLSTEFTLDVILRTVFGIESAEEEASVRATVRALVDEVPPLAIFVPGLQRRWFPPWGRYLRTQVRFAEWLAAKLAERRARPDDARSDDVLSMLLESRYDDGSPMDDAEIHDQLVSLLLAGHETTAIALASAVNRILRHPEVLTRLRAELDAAGTSVEEIVRLPYLAAVLDETMRIDAIVTDVVRKPVAPFALDDALTVTPDEFIVVFIEGVHRDPALYPEPDRFRPERFLERKFAPHEFLPFGGGVRRCLGAGFSDYEAKLFLAAFVRRLDVELLHATPEPRVRRNVTMGPKRGVPVRVRAIRA